MDSILLSPRHGVNPTIPVCFWCGREKNEVALMGYLKGRGGEDIAAPMHMVIDYEPCDECRQNMAQGFTLIEATSKPNAASNVEIQRGVYPTGRYAVLRREAAERIFSNLNVIKRFGIPGFIEFRKYGFGGTYLIIGQVWLTLRRGSMP